MTAKYHLMMLTKIIIITVLINFNEIYSAHGIFKNKSLAGKKKTLIGKICVSFLNPKALFLPTSYLCTPNNRTTSIIIIYLMPKYYKIMMDT